MILAYSIGIAFIVSSIAITFCLNKKSLFNPYLDMLTDDEREKYDQIVIERRNIYLTGFGIGLFIAILMMFLLTKTLTPLQSVGIGVAIVYSISYFFYMLFPKSDYMIQYLDKKDERQAWWKIYRTLQFYYHLAFALGLFGSLLLFYGIRVGKQ